MNGYCTSNYIVMNSTNEAFRFYLDKDKKIKYEFYDSNQFLTDEYLVSDDKIISFSVDIDSNDRIHLIYLNNEGKINYYLYSSNKWAKKTLTQLDIKSNYYNYLTLKLNKESVHIFFSFSNLVNKKVWTIQHLIGTKGNWEKINAISFTSSKMMPLYSFDFDRFDNIHMLYTSNLEGSQAIQYVYFNSSSKKWCQVPQLIAKTELINTNPQILVDLKDNIHALWLVHDGNLFKAKYKHYSGLGINKNTWREETLYELYSDSLHPVIFQYKDSLNILSIFKNEITCLTSNDYGFHWSQNDTYYINKESKICSAKYIISSTSDRNMQKFNHVYLLLDSIPCLLKSGPIKHLQDYSSQNYDYNLNSNISNKDIIDEEDSIEQKSFQNENEEKAVDQTSKFIDIKHEIESVYQLISTVSNEIIELKKMMTLLTSQFETIEDTLQIFNESIDLNNQCFLDIDKKLYDLTIKRSKRGFWSRLFNRY